MVRTFLVALALCMSATLLHAGSLLELGVRAGANLTFAQNLPEGFEATTVVGWNAGLIGHVGLGDLLAVGADLYYENRRLTLERVLEGEVTKTDVFAGSLNLPVYAKIGLPLKFMFEAGVMYSYFINESEGIIPSGQGFALLGLQWRPLPKWRFGARFLPSFTSISAGTYDDLGANVTQLYIGYVLL